MEFNLKKDVPITQANVGDLLVFEDGRIRYLAYDDKGYCTLNLQSGRVTSSFYEEKGLLLANLPKIERVIPSNHIVVSEK